VASGPIWTHFPKLEFVEFPWRWLFVLGTCLTLLVSAALARHRPFWLALALLVMAMAGGIASGRATHWRRQMLPGLLESIKRTGGYDGSPQYVPPRANPDLFYRNRDMPPAVAGNANTTIHILRWTPEYKSLRTRAAASSSLVLHLLDYPSWQGTVNGRRVALAADDMGRIVLDVPRGESNVEVSFRRTPDRSLGIAISLAAVMVLAAILWRKTARMPMPASHFTANQIK